MWSKNVVDNGTPPTSFLALATAWPSFIALDLPLPAFGAVDVLDKTQKGAERGCGTNQLFRDRPAALLWVRLLVDALVLGTSCISFVSAQSLGVKVMETKSAVVVGSAELD